MKTQDSQRADQVIESQRQEIQDLRHRLAEAEEALSAIREGQVDAIVVDGTQGAQIFSLSGAETVYRLAVETMTEAALNVTPAGQILFCNERFGQFVRTPILQVLGRNLDQFIDPEDTEPFRAMLDECRQQPVQKRVVFRAPDGKLTATHLTGHALHQGQETSLCLVATDLTELESSAGQIEQLRKAQRELELTTAALRESEERYRQSEERMQQALLVSHSFTFDWEPATDKVMRSESCATILHLTGEEVRNDTGQRYFQRVHPDDRARFVQMLRLLTPASNAYATEYRVKRGDGSVVVLEEVAQATFDAAGNFDRLVGVATDITERKEAESALQASLREKDVLLHEVHHRVKNNLQVISSLVSLQAGTITGPERATFESVRDQVRAMALVHEKLYQVGDFGRIEFAEYARSLLEQLWRAHGEAASRAKLALDLQPVILPLTMAVPCGLILNELAVNTLKHAFRGSPAGGRVTVTLTSTPEGRACLRVADNGKGLPKGLDWQTSKSLGLRLVHLLANQLRAAVEMRRPETGGSEFEVTFAVDQEL